MEEEERGADIAKDMPNLQAMLRNKPWRLTTIMMRKYLFADEGRLL